MDGVWFPVEEVVDGFAVEVVLGAICFGTHVVETRVVDTVESFEEVECGRGGFADVAELIVDSFGCHGLEMWWDGEVVSIEDEFGHTGLERDVGFPQGKEGDISGDTHGGEGILDEIEEEGVKRVSTVCTERRRENHSRGWS